MRPTKAKKLRERVKVALIAITQRERISERSKGMARRMLAEEEQMWTFLSNPKLPIHNNEQERELRTPVIKRKISFGNDSAQGAQFYSQLLSVILSLERQGRDVIATLFDFLSGTPTSLISQN